MSICLDLSSLFSCSNCENDLNLSDPASDILDLYKELRYVTEPDNYFLFSIIFKLIK